VDGNISEDPIFCDPQNADFQLAANSPCTPFAPLNPECDLIGAWPVACGSTPGDPHDLGEDPGAVFAGSPQRGSDERRQRDRAEPRGGRCRPPPPLPMPPVRPAAAPRHATPRRLSP